ncbi:MAG: proline racemase family protein [bacterium]|nr:proline racemase family protein [Acidimicrobiia bacterium]MCY4650061.1 proline racemase family protein [bacterium]
MRMERAIQAVDLHAAGEHARVIVDGVPDVPGVSMFEKMQYLERHSDWLRKLMLREPRGYPAANCNLVLPPTVPEADAGFVIMEQTEYPPMSGHNTMCTVTALIETGMVPSREPVTELTLETPAGLLRVEARVDGGKVTSVTFENVPAFPVHLGATVEVPTLGEVEVDVAWGGMFFAIADAARFGLSISPENGRDLVRITTMVKQAAREQLEAVHPENPEIRQASIGMLTEPFDRDSGRAKNAVTVATGELDWDRPETWTGALDRSPCGTGTSARMAVLHARGELEIGEHLYHHGTLDTVFIGRLIRETTVGGVPAVVPTITGTAWITGKAQYLLDPTDPFPEGYTIGDIWG